MSFRQTKLNALMVAGFVLSLGATGLPAANLPTYAKNVVVSGLNEPAGVAVHPVAGTLFVAEQGAGRIVAIRDGKPTPVISSGWTLVAPPPGWLARADKPIEQWAATTLDKPGAMAVDTNGHIFVCEFKPHGRILEFIPDAAGQYTTARLITIGWIDRPYTWQDIEVTADGRIFVSESVREARGLKFGSVLMRAADGEWWVADYGPFMDFSGIALSRKDDILVVAERKQGGLIWWDIFRHLPIGESAQSVDKPEISALALTANGAFAMAHNLLDDAGGTVLSGEVILSDPLTGETGSIAQGFKQIGGVALNPQTGTLLVTDQGAGQLVELAAQGAEDKRGYLLQRSLAGYEFGEGFTPRVAPTFMKNFFSKVGLAAEEEKKGVDGEVEEQSGMAFSLREFAYKIPLIAGKIEAKSLADSPAIKDPIKSIEFVLLYPGRTMISGCEEGAPSVSFFVCRRASGAVQSTTNFLQNAVIMRRSSAGTWQRECAKSSVAIPIATVNMQKNENGMLLNLVFLGLGVYDDYYLNLDVGKENRGEIIVANSASMDQTDILTANQDAAGGIRERYEAVMEDLQQTGSGEAGDRNILVAGFDPVQESAGIGWLSIGRGLITAALSTTLDDYYVFSGMGEDVKSVMYEKNLEWQITLQEQEAQRATNLPPETAETTNSVAPGAGNVPATNAPPAEPAAAAAPAAPQAGG